MYYTGVGFVFGATPTLILGMVSATRRAEATAFNAVVLRIGAAVGTQLAATLVTASIGAGGHPSEGGYAGAFLFEAAVTTAALVVALAIPVGARRRVEPAPIPSEA